MWMALKTTDEQDFDRTIGEFLRRTRESLYISQTELGRRVGISAQQIQKYECGANRMSVWRLRQIANALELSVASFFENDFPNAPCRIMNYNKTRDLIDRLTHDINELRREIMPN